MTPETGATPVENGREFKLRWSVIVQVASWLVMALLTYSAINARVSVIEVRQNRIESDVSEIKNDVKALLRATAKGG